MVRTMSLYLIGVLLVVLVGVAAFFIYKFWGRGGPVQDYVVQDEQQKTPSSTGTGREDLGPAVPGFKPVPAVYDPTARVTFKNDGTKTCLATDSGNNDAVVSAEICNNTDTRQHWKYDINTKKLENVQGICLQAGTGVIGWSCLEDSPNQQWAYSIQDQVLKNNGTGKCLGLKNEDGVGLEDCSPNTSTQKWTVGIVR